MAAGSLDEAPREPTDLARVARDCFELGSVRWPTVRLEVASLEQYFGRLGADARPSPAHQADVYLACACAQGIASALAVVEPVLTADVARAVASVDPSRPFVADVIQVVRQRVFVPANGRPARIASYAGVSSLRSWLCAVGVRCALTQRRTKSGRVMERAGTGELERFARGGPELEYLRHRYKGAFEDAVRVAVTSLTRPEQTLLRLNLFERMSIDGLAVAYGVSRATAARRLASARAALLRKTRDELRSKVHLTSTEVESIASVLRSQLEINMAELLASRPALE